MNGAASDHSNDVAFAQAWDRWFQEHPQHEAPPALVVITGIDRPDFGGGWKTDDHVTPSAELRQSLIRAQFDSLRSLLPIGFQEYVAVGLSEETPAAVIEHVVPAIMPLLLKAERHGAYCVGCTRFPAVLAWAGSCSRSVSTASRSGAL